MLAKTFRCRFFFFSDLRCCCCFFPGFYFFFFSVPTYIYLFIRAVGPCTRNAFIPGDRPSSQRDTIFVFGIFFPPLSLSLSHSFFFCFTSPENGGHDKRIRNNNNNNNNNITLGVHEEGRFRAGSTDAPCHPMYRLTYLR